MPDQKDPKAAALKKFHAIVRAACKNQSSIEDQVKYVENEVEKSSGMRAHLIEPAFQCLFREAVTDYRHNIVSQIKFSTNPGHCERPIEGLSGVSVAAEMSLLDRKMPNGKRLGELLGNQLDPLIVQESNIAQGHARQAEFYRLLRKKTPDSDRVGEKVSHAMARVLWKAACGGRASPDTHESNAPADADHKPVGTHPTNVARSAVA